MKKFIFLPLLLCFASISLWAQSEAKGKIAGKVIDKATGEELIGVTVRIENTNQGAATDIEGKFLLSVEPGKYLVNFNYSAYQPQQLEVEVKRGEVSFVNVTLDESANELTEVVVTYTVEKSSSLALLTERKNAVAVSDGVSAELIRRTPDRTTSDVLKRVTGASIQEGRFAVIRGMNDRYNAGYLDGALLPSTESDRKAFAFDVVPANLIDNLQIIKAGSPDMIGDFGGGIIRINTKAVPETFTQTITLGAQTHSLTQFNGFRQFKRYPGEAFNFPGNQRNLPALQDGDLRIAGTFPRPEEKERLATVSQQFNNDWSNETIDALPNSRIAYSLGFPVRLANDNKLGVLLALNYANTRRFSEGQVNTFDGGGQVAAFQDSIYAQNISSGGIFNINYVAAKTQINFRNLLNFNTDNNTIRRSGTANYSDGVLARNMANLINYNRLYNGIVSVKQIFGDNLFNLNASANFSNVRRRIPDYRIINYTRTPDMEDYGLTLGDFFNTSTGRFSSDLQENLYGGTLELGKTFDGSAVKTTVSVGGFYQHRDRSFFGRSFVYQGNGGTPTFDPANDLGANNIAANKLFLIEKTSNDLGYYDGRSDLMAGYASVDQKLFSRLRAVYGVRYEHVDITVDNPKVGLDIAHINQGVVLPSANLTFSLTEKMNLRGSYYASVNRPEFRELAPFSFYVFEKNAEIRGNKDLQIAKLNNFDLRYEFYPSGSQVLSIGGFYKSIQNPVEFSIDISQPFTTFTFENEKSATIYGLEIELRKNFDFFGDRDFWRELTIFSNLALIRSELAFDEGSQALQDRPLQGQSPYVLNAGLQYESMLSGWFASAVVNRVGRRIAFVGVDPKFGDTRQDIYEAPRTVLDLQFGKNIGRLNLKFTLGDLLRQDQVFYQDANQDGKFSSGNGSTDRRMFSFTQGYTMSLTAGYNF